MAFNPNSPLNIGGKGIQGGLPTDGQTLQFNATTNRWEYALSQSNTFARVVKKLTETIDTDIVPHDDTELFVPLAVNKIYNFMMFLWINSAIAAGFRFDFTIPAGATGRRLNGSWTATTFQPTVAITTIQQEATAAVDQLMKLSGIVNMGATPGNLQFRWAQNNSSGSNTSVLQGCSMVVWEELP